MIYTKIEFQKAFIFMKYLSCYSQLHLRHSLLQILVSYQQIHQIQMKRWTSALLNTKPLSSAESIDSITPPPRESTSASSISTIEPLYRQNSTQQMPLQERNEVIQALTRISGKFGELHIIKICLDDVLIWLLIESNLNRLFLQACTLDLNSVAGFGRMFEFLSQGNSSEFCFKFGVQFNNSIAQWIIYDEPSKLAFGAFRPVASLLVILSNNLPQQSFPDDISSLAVLPSKFDPNIPFPPEYKNAMKSIMNRPLPRLRNLLLRNINLDDKIEDSIPILWMGLDLIYLWNCSIKSDNPIWIALHASIELVGSMQKIRTFQIAIPTNGHIVKIVENKTPSFLTPNSPDLSRGLILSLNQNPPDDLSLYDVSLLTLLSSEKDLSNKQLTPQYKQNLKSIMGHQNEKLKYLFLIDLNIDGKIEDFISISQLKLDLIYLWSCYFRSENPIWSALCESINLINLMETNEICGHQFTIPINGYTMQVVTNRGPSFLIPGSSDLIYGLVLSLEQDLPSSQLLNSISLLALLPSYKGFMEPLSVKSKKNLEVMINNQYPNLKYLLLKYIDFHGNIDPLISILHPKLNLVYLWNCGFASRDPIWSSILGSMELLDSKQLGNIQGFQFAISIYEHITKIVVNETTSFLIPNSPDLVHGLILFLGQDIPSGLLLKSIFFIILHPAEVLPIPRRSLTSQPERTLKSIRSHSLPKLRYLFLNGVPHKDIEELDGFIESSKLDVYTLEVSGSS